MTRTDLPVRRGAEVHEHDRAIDNARRLAHVKRCTARRTQAPAAPEPLGYELAAEGGFEPSELVITSAQEKPTEPPDKLGKTD